MAAELLLRRSPPGDEPAGAGETAPHTDPSSALARLRMLLPPEMTSQVSSGRDLAQARRNRKERIAPTTVAALDKLLGGGLPKGRLVEIASSRSSGRFSIVMSALAAATSSGDVAALVDLGDHLSPESAEDAGVDLPRLLWVRPRTTKDAVHAAELLITTGFPLVVVDLGLRLSGRKVADASWIRLARAAQAHGTALLVSSPWPVSGTAAAAAIRLELPRLTWAGTGRAPRLLTGTEARLTIARVRDSDMATREGALEEVMVRQRDAIRSP